MFFINEPRMAEIPEIPNFTTVEEIPNSLYRDMFYFVIGFLSKDEEKMSKIKFYLESNFNFKLGGGNVDSE